jgi:hypothetical protein
LNRYCRCECGGVSAGELRLDTLPRTDEMPICGQTDQELADSSVSAEMLANLPLAFSKESVRCKFEE